VTRTSVKSSSLRKAAEAGCINSSPVNLDIYCEKIWLLGCSKSKRQVTSQVFNPREEK
jgi:hypothetical protein